MKTLPDYALACCHRCQIGCATRWEVVDHRQCELGRVARVADDLTQLRDSYHLAARLGFVVPISADLNGAEPEGASWYELNIVNRGRQSAADALHPASAQTRQPHTRHRRDRPQSDRVGRSVHGCARVCTTNGDISR
jgi:hypothetical protein